MKMIEWKSLNSMSLHLVKSADVFLVMLDCFRMKEFRGIRERFLLRPFLRAPYPNLPAGFILETIRLQEALQRFDLHSHRL